MVPTGCRLVPAWTACSTVLGLCLVLTVQAQESYQGYRFAPRDGSVPDAQYPVPDYGGAGRAGDEWGTQSPLVSPTGRPYVFRDSESVSSDSEQPRFRPDSQLGQMPKNWGMDQSWASDPVLQQGFIFRPLDKGRKAEQQAAPSVPAPVPSMAPYQPGYVWPGAQPGIYPPPYSSGGYIPGTR